MFILDSFLGWVLRTVGTAAEAEMNDEDALREQLLEAEMQREAGEISDGRFAEIEADLLARIREIRERRGEGAGPLTFGGAEPMALSPDTTLQVEASVSGDFHEPAEAPHTTVVESEPGFEEQISVLDIEPGPAEPASDAGLPLTPSPEATRTTRTIRTTRTGRTTRTRTPRRRPQGKLRTS